MSSEFWVTKSLPEGLKRGRHCSIVSLVPDGAAPWWRGFAGSWEGIVITFEEVVARFSQLREGLAEMRGYL